jgi:hypothetical protein
MYNRRRRGRFTFQSQPTKETRAMQRVASVPFLIVSVFFVIIGVTTLIPQAGLFGIMWTLLSASFVVIGVLNLVRKNGPAHRVAYDLDPAEPDEPVIEHMFSHEIQDVDGPDRDGPDRAPAAGQAQPEHAACALDAQGRLEQLQRLLDAGLVTKEEYTAKREEILREL